MIKMTDNKNDFQSHFHRPNIPPPPPHGHFDSDENKKDGSKPEHPEKEESPSLSKWFKGLTKKQKIIFISALTAAVALFAFLSWWFIFRSTEVDEPEPVAIEESAPPPITEASKLTGLQVGFDINKRPVTAVMVENSPEARPQSGLNEAGVVYEAVAEGGITRFMALFQDYIPGVVGPVRSARPYYLDYLVPYDASIAHAGGSALALQQIRTQGIKDLDQFSNPGPYWRDSARFSPHNLYTSIEQLLAVQAEKGWGAADYQSLVRGEEDAPAATPTATKIGIEMSRSLYRVDYLYDPATNSYLRSLANQPHTDAVTGLQLSPKVVVVPIVPRSQDGIYSVYSVDGSGPVLVFQNGTVTSGTWQKPNRGNQMSLFDDAGEPLKLIPGQTWFTLAASAGDVTYAP